MIPKDMIPYLEMIAKEYSGILVTGKGASGKSTFMNAMLDKIPFDNSVEVIQEAMNFSQMFIRILCLNILLRLRAKAR